MKDVDKILEDCLLNGVEKVVTVGTDIKDSKKVLNLSRRYAQVYGACGIHPHESKAYSERDIERLDQTLGEKIIAVGEIGLDFYKNYSPRDKQVEIFTLLLDYAAEKRLPVIVHTRNAESETLKILSERKGKIKGVIHCFSGSMEFLKKMLDLEFFISYAGNITYKKEDEAKKLLKNTSLDRILFETDAPFLAPVPFRGKRNKPSYVRFVYQFSSKMMGIEIERLEHEVDRNFKTLFLEGS